MTIRPAYRNDAWIGFALNTGREPIGKVYPTYKLCYRALVTFTGTSA